MTTGAPITMSWDGEALRPVSSFWAKRADKEFVIGERYNIVDEPERSQRSHSHYFAALNNAYQSLIPELAERFPSVEHFRKYLLIQAGYCNTNVLPCSSEEEARKVAAFIKPMDEFALVTSDKNIVYVFTAKSQSRRAMNGQEFQDSKSKVLELAAEMIGTDAATLQDNAEAAA